MDVHSAQTRRGALPGDDLPQIVPSEVCLRCDVCCRFPERESFLRPYFTAQERERAIASGLASDLLPDPAGGRITLVPHPTADGYICPAFDTTTQYCRIYDARPLDCRIYPLALMRDEDDQGALLGLDTKCPYVQDAAHEARLIAYARQVGALFQEPALRSVLSDNPALVNRFQGDVRPICDVGSHDQ
jgi:Fe-S-cluster containining protein